MAFIVLDFDETYTAAPKVFDALIVAAIGCDKTELIICTARHNRPHDNNSDVEKLASKFNLDAARLANTLTKRPKSLNNK